MRFHALATRSSEYLSREQGMGSELQFEAWVGVGIGRGWAGHSVSFN